MTLRPAYLTLFDRNGSNPRHFQADNHVTAWLEANNYTYNIVTDQELHDEGSDAIKAYPVVMTGSPPSTTRCKRSTHY